MPRSAVVTGMIATYPVGGVVWDYGQYALGLEQLGFDVYYLEDTGSYTYDPARGEYGEDCTYAVEFLERALTFLSPALARRWHFRSLGDRAFGIAAAEMRDIVAGADVFVNVSGGCLLRDAYVGCRRKLLIDTDPGWNHFVNYPKWDASPGWLGTHGWRRHDVFFTYATRIGQPGCSLPTLGLAWHPTVPPVAMDRWRAEPPGDTWTTVMTWNNFGRQVEHEGRRYGTKEMEFGRVEALPGHVDARLELAVGGSGAPIDRWRGLGWAVVDSHGVSRTADDYRSYLQRSRGEFSVAKNLYVATESGWFSCRSVCYLAAGRPVVVQDTGYSQVIPAGEGLHAFTTLDEAAAAVRRVESRYEEEQQAARALAATHFDARRVLESMLNVALG